MPDWPLEQVGRLEFMPDAPNPFTGKVVTAGGTAHVMGSYTALGNAPFCCCAIQIFIRNHSSATDYLCDVAIGAAGSEQVVIWSLYTSGPGSSSRSKQYLFPLRLPANTRVSVRCQNATISSTLACGIIFYEESFLGAPSCQRIVTYGDVRSTSSGTAMAAPAANAWGAYTALTAATVDQHSWICPVFGDQDLATRTAQSHVFETAIGAAGSERRLCPPQFFHASSTALHTQFWPGYWANIPLGSRLSSRYSAVAATNLGLDVVIYAGCR